MAVEVSMSPALTPPPADVLLSDGTVACIRPLRAADEAGLLALHDHVDDESLRLRFFTLNRKAGHEYVEHLVHGTRDTVQSLVAVVNDGIVAEATAERVSRDSAEVASLVADEVRGHGVGSLLPGAPGGRVSCARHPALRREVLSGNDKMWRVFRDAGFTLTGNAADGVVTVEISTAATPQAAADLRESRSEELSLRPLLYPTSVAVAGIRRQGGGIGNAVLKSILDGGFTGSLFVVHPQPSRSPASRRTRP
jgi:hypothetical protein